MAADSYGPKGEPQFSGSGVPQDAADMSEVAAYAAKYGNYRADTSAVRNSLTGSDRWPGLIFFETDTGLTWLYSGSGWAMAYNALPRLRMTRSSAAGISASSGFQTVGMTTFQQENGSLFTGSSGFTTPITGRYAIHLACSAPNSPTGTRRVIGLAPSSAPNNVVAQSSGAGAANDTFSLGIDHMSEATLQAGTPYAVVASSTNALNFSAFDVSVRLIAPTTIG